MTVTEPAPFVHPGVDTDSLAPVAPLGLPGDRTMRDEVLAELKTKKPHRHVTLLVPGREGYSVEFDTHFNADLMRGWAKEATDDQGLPDMFRLALLVLAGQCVAIWRQGERLTIADRPVTFASPALAEVLEVVPGQVTLVVREFYASDNDVAAVHQRLMQEASAGSLDPTPESSS